MLFQIEIYIVWKQDDKMIIDVRIRQEEMFKDDKKDLELCSVCSSMWNQSSPVIPSGSNNSETCAI